MAYYVHKLIILMPLSC